MFARIRCNSAALVLCLCIAARVCESAVVPKSLKNTTDIIDTAEFTTPDATTTTTSTTTTPPPVPGCPKECICTPTHVNCNNAKLVEIPPSLAKMTGIRSISLRNNSIRLLNLYSLPHKSLEVLILSNNMINSMVNVSRKLDSMPSLETLDLSDNNLSSLVDTFAQWKWPSLEELNLSNSRLGNLSEAVFQNAKNLTDLRLDNCSKLQSIHELTFAPLTQLRRLNMSNVHLKTLNHHHLPDTALIKCQKLEFIDLTNNDLFEVPVALRVLKNLKKLILNQNNMTSLRSSDFIVTDGCCSPLQELEVQQCMQLSRVDDYTFADMLWLKTLVLSENPKLSYISPMAFASRSKQSSATNLVRLELLDLSSNNFTSMSDPNEYIGLNFQQILLNNNPWNCNCDLKWLDSAANVRGSPVLHCKQPEKYRDIDVGRFFKTNQCDEPEKEAGIFTLILAGAMLFVLGALVATLAQRMELWRRLMWKDQYGTVYYTKASFPTEAM